MKPTRTRTPRRAGPPRISAGITRRGTPPPSKNEPNAHAVPVEFELTYLPRDHDNTEALTRQFSVGPGQSTVLDDVVRETFQTTGSGALLVRSDRPLVVVSRTFNDTPDDTFGQFIAGVDQGFGVREGQVGHLLMLEESEAFRSNFGLVNLSSFEVLTGGGRVLSYASTVDNRTEDPVFQTAWTNDRCR